MGMCREEIEKYGSDLQGLSVCGEAGVKSSSEPHGIDSRNVTQRQNFANSSGYNKSCKNSSHRSRQLVSLQLLPVWKCSATRLFMKLANSFFIIQVFLLFSGIYCICNWNIFLQNDETWKGNFWINHVLIAYISLVQSSPPSLRWPLKRRCWEKREQMKKKLISCKWRSNNWNQPNSLIWYFGINLFVFLALNVNSSQKAQQFSMFSSFCIEFKRTALNRIARLCVFKSVTSYCI